jgi:hypothetical protein
VARASSKPSATLAYPLGDHNQNFIDHWLTLDAFDRPLEKTPLPGENRASQPARLLAQASQDAPDFAQVVELAQVTELDRVTLGGVERVWEVTHCPPDHLLAWPAFLPALTYRQAWATVQLHSAQAQSVTLHLSASATGTGAARLWLNGALLLHTPLADAPGLVSDAVTVTLQAGSNALLLRLEQTGVRDAMLMAAVRVEKAQDSASPLTLHLPTVTQSPRRRQRLEEIYAQARLDRAVYTPRDPVRLVAPARGRDIPVQLRVQKRNGAIYAETLGTLNPGATIESVQGSQLPNGALDAVVMAPFQQFYNEKLRARHTIPILIANRPFYAEPETAAVQSNAPHHVPNPIDLRLIETLRAQVQSGPSVYGELAKMAFGAWEQVENRVIEDAVARVMEGAADALPDLLALITLRGRMPAYQGFPSTLLSQLDHGLTHVAADADNDFAAWEEGDEAAQLARMAARHLVGQLYPGPNRGQVTADALVAWLLQRGQAGFARWHSDHELLVFALAPLISLAQDENVRASAAALLDTLALAWAFHSWRGTFGASRGRATSNSLRSGRFAPEAALTRLLWGVGGYQSGGAAATALALASTSYTLPAVVRAIALAELDAAWIQERHAEANVATYKTPDYLLSSVQDYHAGRRGAREHIWQATLGPEALIYSNHPGSYQQADQAAPGWWVGNGVLPRVAQYHDALIARYKLPATEWLGFTHAYFPLYAFDEHVIAEGWAFGRVGDGYVALGAAPAFTLVQEGPDAGRELRVVGRETVWCCQMGRRAVDGDFVAFQRAVLAGTVQCAGEQVTWTTARGDTLILGNSGPLRVNGQAIALDDFPRHKSPFGQAPFPADHLEIVYGEDGLRLHF